MPNRLFAPAAIAVALVALAMTGRVHAEGAGGGEAAALMKEMRIADAFAVISVEGAGYGKDIASTMFQGGGGASWTRAVEAIYAPERALPVFEAAFSAELSGVRAEVPAMIAFFGSPLGQRITELEISARRALLDSAVEDESRLHYQELAAAGDPLVARVEEFVAANDLVETNVVGALNADYAFYQGLGDVGALQGGMTEAEIIAEVWSREDAIRGETDAWIHSYLTMAYAPLTPEDIESYVAFSKSEAGRALNRALFAGFDAVFVDVSRHLGRAAGSVLAGHDL